MNRFKQIFLAGMSSLLLPLAHSSAQAQVGQCTPVATPPVVRNVNQLFDDKGLQNHCPTVPFLTAHRDLKELRTDDALSGTFLALRLPWMPALANRKTVAQRCEARFIFYEGNSARQDRLGEIPGCFSQFYLLTDSFTNFVYRIPNDEARSVVLRNIPAGTRLRVYDSGKCSSSNAWGEILAKKHLEEALVYSFQIFHEDDAIRITWVKNKGKLDGKISCIEVLRP